MAEKEAFGHRMRQKEKTSSVKYLGAAALLLALAVSGCSGGGEKSTAGKTEQKPVAQENVAPATVAAPPPAATAPPVKETPPAKPVDLSLRIPPEEFRLRFNKYSELAKSKLRINKLAVLAGAEHDTFKHVFNDNLYLTGKVNKGDGFVVELDLAGVLNGSLATTVDLNQGIGSIVTAVSPGLSLNERNGVLNALGINNDKADIYNLDRKVNKNGFTYWTRSSRKAGLLFGVKNIDDI